MIVGVGGDLSRLYKWFFFGLNLLLNRGGGNCCWDDGWWWLVMGDMGDVEDGGVVGYWLEMGGSLSWWF